VISSYASALALPLSHVLTRLDGLYSNAAPLADLLSAGGPGVIVRGKDYHLLNLPAVSARLQQPTDQQTRHPESGTSRALYDCLDIPLTPTGPRVRKKTPYNQSTTASVYALPVHRDARHPAQGGERLYVLVARR